MGQGAGLSQTSLTTGAPILEPVSVGASMIPAPKLIHQPGATEHEVGYRDDTTREATIEREHDSDLVSKDKRGTYNFTRIRDKPGSYDGRGPDAVTRPGPPTLSSAGGGSRLRNPTSSSTLNDDHDAGGQSWGDTRDEDLVLPTSATADHNGHLQSCAALLINFGNSANFALAIAPLTSYSEESDVPDHWLSENFPIQLPSICRDIWEGVGYANVALKCALLAFDFLTRIGDIYAKNGRSQCLELYSLALQATSGKLEITLHVTQVLIAILILTIFLHVEAKVGSFAGGLVHYKHADSLIVQHIHQLLPWQTD